MPAYKAYPTSKDTPNRMTRKRARRDIFAFNKQAMNEVRKARKKKREEEKEARTEEGQ